MKKKLFVITMVLLLTFSLFACGQKETPAETDESATEETATEESTEETTAAADMKVAMVTDYGDITDQSFNQQPMKPARHSAMPMVSNLFTKSLQQMQTLTVLHPLKKPSRTASM